MSDSLAADTAPSTAPENTAADPLDQLKLKGHCIVAGLQWGDEGKGKIVDLLARRYDVVVRYNGGANAGHSVQVGSVRFALHLIPSGILYPDKINVIGNGVVVDPAKVIEEITGLAKRGVKITSNLRISDRAHVVFPYHKTQDALVEAAFAKAPGGRGDGHKIGTTGRGIGPCYADKATRSTGIRMGELLEADKFRERLAHVVTVKNAMLAGLASAAGEKCEPFDAKKLADEFLAYGDALKDHICDTTQLLHDSIADGKELLFEGANAALLDIDHGTYPFVTSSNCSSLGVGPGSGVPAGKVSHTIGIMKAYQTRVGGGPMPTELHDETGSRIREVGREYGTTTGRPRRCGWLDLVSVKYTAMISGATGIGLMLLDVLAGLSTLKVCTAYKHKGAVLKGFPADATVLAEVEPVYEDVKGFGEDIRECRQYADLPAEAKAYVERIEKYVGVPVRIVSVGPARDQTLVR
ncbi:MAG: adenylosuccinate synthase [Phycisphaeraceae bacterium]